MWARHWCERRRVCESTRIAVNEVVRARAGVTCGGDVRINLNQQLAVQATLDALMGRQQFERLCTGMRVHIDNDILYVFVSNESCAAEINASFSDDLAVAAEQALGKPVRTVRVLPMDLFRQQE